MPKTYPKTYPKKTKPKKIKPKIQPKPVSLFRKQILLDNFDVNYDCFYNCLSGIQCKLPWKKRH